MGSDSSPRRVRRPDGSRRRGYREARPDLGSPFWSLGARERLWSPGCCAGWGVDGAAAPGRTGSQRRSRSNGGQEFPGAEDGRGRGCREPGTSASTAVGRSLAGARPSA